MFDCFVNSSKSFLIIPFFDCGVIFLFDLRKKVFDVFFCEIFVGFSKFVFFYVGCVQNLFEVFLDRNDEQWFF